MSTDRFTSKQILLLAAALPALAGLVWLASGDDRWLVAGVCGIGPIALIAVSRPQARDWQRFMYGALGGFTLLWVGMFYGAWVEPGGWSAASLWSNFTFHLKFALPVMLIFGFIHTRKGVK